MGKRTGDATVALVDIPYQRVELGAHLIGHDVELTLGASSMVYRGVVVATLPHERRLLIQLPDELVRIAGGRP